MPTDIEPDTDAYDYFNGLLNAAYTERAHLLSFLSTWAESVLSYNDPKEPTWAVLYVNVPTGQMTWHIAPSDMHLFNHVPVVPGDDLRAQWDGHDTEEKYKRFRVMTEFAREVRDVVSEIVGQIDPMDPNLKELRVSGVYESDEDKKDMHLTSTSVDDDD